MYGAILGDIIGSPYEFDMGDKTKDFAQEVVPADPEAEDVAAGMWGELSWGLNEEGLLTVCGTGAMEDYEMISVVTWLDYASSIQTAEICDGVTSIGAFAFDHCDSLTDITIPDSVTSIGAFAFDHCSSLTEVTIPDSVTPGFGT